jgi:hypothetical protein
MSDAHREHFCALWRFAGLETPASYLDAVQAAGFRVLYHEDTSAHAVRFYSRLVEVYQEHRTEFESARGSERYPWTCSVSSPTKDPLLRTRS